MNTTLQIFDVEHGACALLTSKLTGGILGNQRRRMMIDCGHNASTEWRPGDHLSNMRIFSLEYLVVTNYDEDHVSGFINLQSRKVAIQTILRNESVSPLGIQHLKSKDGMGPNIAALVSVLSSRGNPSSAFTPRAPIPDVWWSMHYNGPSEFQDENNLSAVLHLVINGWHFLFPGDMECAGWQSLLARDPGLCTALREIDFFIAPHHGRADGICPEIFEKWNCRPWAVIISDCAKKYQSQETVDYYRSKCRGIPVEGGNYRYVLTTRANGNITFTIDDASNCRVNWERG